MGLIERVAEAVDQDPARVRPVLQLLVGEEPELDLQLRPLADSLNTARRGHAMEEFMAGAITTDGAIERLPSITTRQGVHRLRKARRLWGRTIGNTTWFPAWQFGAGGLRDDLGEILDRISAFTTDVVAADRIMRLPRPELGGATIAEALHDERRRGAAMKVLAGLSRV